MKAERGKIDMKMQAKEMRRQRRGFTLVELLVSVALTVFMLTLFATLFSAGNDAVRIARGTSEVDRTVQSAITKLRRDLQFVYVGDNVSLSKAFSAPDQVPTAGYFTIEENMPGSPPPYLSDSSASNNILDPSLKSFVQTLQARMALTPIGYGGPNTPVTLYRQGIDERGLPVDADVDDVLAFTVKLTGNSPENIFYGRVPIGSILDSDLDPGSRFDQPDNGIFTSPSAEVVYFLRADRPYTLADINRSALGSDDGRISTPATFTLYRRELLLLSPQQRTEVEKKITTGIYGFPDASGTGKTASALNDIIRIQSIPGYLTLNPMLNSANGAYYNPSVYQNYDVSFYYGFDSRKFTSGGNVGDLKFFSLRFNDTNTIRVRQNRYGLQWLVAPPLNSILLQSPDTAAPGYDHPPIANALVRMYVPGPAPSGNTLWWHGRPTLYESTLVGATGVYDSAYNPTVGGGHLASYDTLTDKTSAFYTTLTPVAEARRRDADVLLNNVISFDVKVLNDDIVQGLNTTTLGSGTTATILDPISGTYRKQPIPTADPASWPGARTSALAAIDPVFTSISPNRPNQLAGNSSRPWLATLSPGLIQQDFVDIGYSFMPEAGATLVTGTPACLLDPNYLSSAITLPLPESEAIPWGTQTPSRWMSTGRRESSYNFYAPTATTPLGMVYDTWAPEYRPELFANVLLGAPVPVPPQSFLPPYDRPIRGLQITIRILEPKTGLTRDFQIVHRFN
jgi:type II secretory pathway pseudopilin PulG